MSDQEPQQPSNRPPSQPNKPATPTPNWGVWVLILLIVGVLAYAFIGPNSMGFGSKKLTLAEFTSLYRDGRIVQDNKKFPLEVVLSDSSLDGTIYANRYIDKVKPTKITEHTFYMPFSTEDNIKGLMNDLGITDIADDTLEEAPTALARIEAKHQRIDLATFKRLAQEGRLQPLEHNGIKTPAPQIFYNGNQGVVVGTYITRTWPALDSQPNMLEKVEVPFSREMERDKVMELLGNVAVRTDSSTWRTILVNLLPILLVLLILFFIFRSQTGGSGPRSAMNFGKSRARLNSPGSNKITFKDVAGVSEAKEEVWEIVEFLRNPAKFRNLGGVIPKGILMVGPPGTGKTLLARAIAGEADVPFYTISGSDFVEMFVGVGASRVRDMFSEAKKHSPCLIFIDEIDAVGRHRGHGLGGGHDEREQTLNALLVEMDGFSATENVIVIAATNRADVLDPALLRPGRFDRQVTVSLPDVQGREQILRVHARKVKMAENVDLKPIARATVGFSGAELANLINEAALLAARKDMPAITNDELEEAREKVRWGRERRSLAISDKEKRMTAVHEAGHAICILKTEASDPLHKVTIIPRGPALGVTMSLPGEDQFSWHRSEMLDRIVICMGGRCAEEIVYGDVSSGASGDIHTATDIARRMVCEFGMSSRLGPVEYGSSHGEVFLARDISQNTKNYSEHTAQIIDEEIQRIVQGGYDRSIQILRDNRDKLDLITDALVTYETLSGDQVRELLENGTMSSPPDKTSPPPVPSDDDEETDLQTPDDEPPPYKNDDEDQNGDEVAPQSPSKL